MRTKLLTFAATGIAGVALGAGVGVATAQGDWSDQRPARAGDFQSMDEMHAAMRDQMPAELAAQCDEMHAAMPEGMSSMDPDAMGSWMNGAMGGAMSDQHAQHHQ